MDQDHRSLKAAVTPLLRKGLAPLSRLARDARAHRGRTPLEWLRDAFFVHFLSFATDDPVWVEIRDNRDYRVWGLYERERQAIGSGGCLLILAPAFYALWLAYLALAMPLWLIPFGGLPLLLTVHHVLVRPGRSARLRALARQVHEEAMKGAFEQADRIIAGEGDGDVATLLRTDGARLVLAEFTASANDPENAGLDALGTSLWVAAGETVKLVCLGIDRIRCHGQSEALSEIEDGVPERVRELRSRFDLPFVHFAVTLNWSVLPGRKDADLAVIDPDPPLASPKVQPGERVMVRRGARWFEGTAAEPPGDAGDGRVRVTLEKEEALPCDRADVSTGRDEPPHGHPRLEPGDRVRALADDMTWHGGSVTERFGRVFRVDFDGGSRAWLDTSRLLFVEKPGPYRVRRVAAPLAKVAALLALVAIMGASFILPDTGPNAPTAPRPEAINREPVTGPDLALRTFQGVPEPGTVVFSRYGTHPFAFAARVTRVDGEGAEARIEVTYFDEEKEIRAPSDIYRDDVGPGFSVEVLAEVTGGFAWPTAKVKERRDDRVVVVLENGREEEIEITGMRVPLGHR